MLPKSFLFLVLSTGLGFSLTLKEALNLAEKNYYGLKAKRYEYLSAKNAYYAQIAKRFGQITLFYAYNQYKTPRIVAPISPTAMATGTLPTDDQLRTYGFKYTVRLFDGCQQFFLIRAKGKEAELSYIDYSDALAQTRKGVKELYFQILALRAKLSALEERKKAVDELYRIVKTSYEVGKKSLLDLLNVSAERKAVEAAISDLKAKIESTKRQLAVLLGLKDTYFSIEDVKVKPVRFSAQKLLTRFLNGNFKLKEVERKKEITDYYRRAALSEFSPKVDFVYTKQWYRYDDTTRSDWQYTLQVSFPIFDFGLRFFNYRAARGKEKEVEQLRRLTVQEQTQRFFALVNELNAKLDVIDATRERVKFAKKAYAVERKKYLLGKSDVYNLLKAEALYFESLGDYRASLYEWAAKKAELDYMLGY